jgi:hypothetical protein
MAHEERVPLTSSDIDELIELIKMEEEYVLSLIVKYRTDSKGNKARVERLEYLDELSQKLHSLKPR